MINFRTTLVLGIFGVATSCAVSQTVIFGNANLSEPPDRTVYMPDMMTPVGGSPISDPPTFVAQLYYGTNGASADSLQPLTSPPARFGSAGSGSEGIWAGGIRTLSGFGLGFTVALQVRAWDAGGIGLSYDATRALGYLWGDSATFTYKIPSGFNPGDDYMENFRSFSLVPEASTITLAAVGALGLVLWTRRRQ